MLNPFKVVLYVLLTAMLLGMFGVVLPALFSAKSTVAVLAGVVLILVTITVGALALNKIMGRSDEKY